MPCISTVWAMSENGFSLFISSNLHNLSSFSDASLELCVMPKDEDILQLVSIHLSVTCDLYDRKWCIKDDDQGQFEYQNSGKNIVYLTCGWTNSQWNQCVHPQGVRAAGS